LQNSEVPPGPSFTPTLPNLLHEAVRLHADREYLVMGDRRITFGQAGRVSAEWARGLLALGIGKGTRVGLLMPNNPDWVLAFLATSRVGALTVSLSTFFQAPEISWGIRHNDLDTLLISDSYLNNDYLQRLERALPGLAEATSAELHLPEHPYLRRIVVFGPCDRKWAMKGPESLVSAARAKPQIDDAFLAKIESNIVPADWLITICTSGTTAEPKAVVHTHGVAMRAVYIFTHHQDLRPEDRTYSGQAFFWIGGQNMNLIPSLYIGACICFSDSPKASDVVDLIIREQVTRLSLWPAQVLGLAEYAQGQGVDLSFIRQGYGPPRDEAGDVIPPERRAGGWMGMTECFGMHSIENTRSAAPSGKAGNWGRAVPGVERRIVDPVTGKELPPGETGVLYIRGHTLMQGYYKLEREQVFTRDGWFLTGDLASIDEDGYVYFHGRNTEMIKTAGANVSPREVELALVARPGVREAIVFGMPDPVKGEIVVAVVVPFDGETLDSAALRDQLKNEISPYKIPQEIIFMTFDEIPRTGSQKARKRDLQESLAERFTNAQSAPIGRSSGAPLVRNSP
jgi:acyl-coenzyme A synthetase/AMP-(fatty) acid ligase